VYTEEHAVVIKTEVDNNDITEASHDGDGQTDARMFDVFDFMFSAFICSPM